MRGGRVDATQVPPADPTIVPRGTSVPFGWVDIREVVRSLSIILEAELAALAAADRLRSCPEAAGASRVHPTVADQPRLAFCSNDYLGLASDPRLISAATAAAQRDGLGASASRLI